MPMTTIDWIPLDLMIDACSFNCMLFEAAIGVPPTADHLELTKGRGTLSLQTYLESHHPHIQHNPQPNFAGWEGNPLSFRLACKGTTIAKGRYLQNGGVPLEKELHNRMTATLSSLLESCSRTALTNCCTAVLEQNGRN